MDPRDEPAWTTHARRIIPGQDIVINRDEDPEEGDMGLVTREKGNAEKTVSSEDSQGSYSSRTAGQGEAYEMDQRGRVDSRNSRSSQVFEDDDGDDDGARTPPLAEYREGHHLIVERKVADSEEVSEPCDSADIRSMSKSYGITFTTRKRMNERFSGILAGCKRMKWND